MTQKNELLEALKEMLTACELGIPLSGRGLEKARAAIAAAESAVSEPMMCRYGDDGYACCEDGPCQADFYNDSLAGDVHKVRAAVSEPESPTLPMIDGLYRDLDIVESLHGRSGPSIRLRGKLKKVNDHINYLQANEAAVSEPVARVMFNDDGRKTDNLIDRDLPVGTLLYTTPPAAPLPEPLSDNQIEDFGFNMLPNVNRGEFIAFARAIEAAHNIGAKEQ